MAKDKMTNVIKSVAKIKDIKIKPECGDIKFDGFDFTQDQYRRLAGYVKDKTRLTISIEPEQGEMFDD